MNDGEGERLSGSCLLDKCVGVLLLWKLASFEIQFGLQ